MLKREHPGGMTDRIRLRLPIICSADGCNPRGFTMTRKLHILCIGMPVRDLTFGVEAVPGRGSNINDRRFSQISGGNALNAAVGIARLGGRATPCRADGRRAGNRRRFIYDCLAKEGIDTTHLVRMTGAVTPISAIMSDAGGERTIVSFRDPGLWKVQLPAADMLLDDCAAILIESRCAGFVTDLCEAATPRDLPVVFDADRWCRSAKAC